MNRVTTTRDWETEIFEAGRSAEQAEHVILDGEREYVEQAKARLREEAFVLGVARWVVERDIVERATVVSFKIFDWDLRETSDVDALIERAKETVRLHK